MGSLSHIKIFQSNILISICFLLIFSFISANSYAQTAGIDDTLLPKLFDRVKDSVVQITVSNEDPNASALGSGFVFDKFGHIITNDHVIRNRSYNDTNATNTNNVTVTFLNEKSFKAKIISSDFIFDTRDNTN
jgi:S1-C subfamily serine protease